MAARLQYDDALEKFGEEFVARVKDTGTYDNDVKEAFSLLGWLPEDYKKLYIMPEYVQTGFFKNMLWGRRACIQVRSKNFANGMHLVYWDGEEFHDPSTKRTYEWAEVEPIMIWLFKEV